MGTTSTFYDIKPKPLNVFKKELAVEIVGYNIEKRNGDMFMDKNGYNQLDSYVIYSACKYKNGVIAVIGLIDYDLKNKKVFCKVNDESAGPHVYNMEKSVFDKLTPLKDKSYAQEWRLKVIQNFK